MSRVSFSVLTVLIEWQRRQLTCWNTCDTYLQTFFSGTHEGKKTEGKPCGNLPLKKFVSAISNDRYSDDPVLNPNHNPPNPSNPNLLTTNLYSAENNKWIPAYYSPRARTTGLMWITTIHGYLKKETKRIYIAPFIYYVYLKALRHGSQFYLQITPCLPFLRKRSTDGATSKRGKRHLIAAYYSSIDPEGMKGWVGLVGSTTVPHNTNTTCDQCCCWCCAVLECGAFNSR